ncbi:hypothetical protein [Paraburkholderia caffeinitolerans]|uniref:hypothetical protein n=1 Tax=Paraburkholderia caffeinitolerans TaxID=1723730 RepID=UPI001583F8D4|nr:hypothetical protein [Paraburkholderia caffeinitolerans]
MSKSTSQAESLIGSTKGFTEPSVLVAQGGTVIAQIVRSDLQAEEELIDALNADEKG